MPIKEQKPIKQQKTLKNKQTVVSNKTAKQKPQNQYSQVKKSLKSDKHSAAKPDSAKASLTSDKIHPDKSEDAINSLKLSQNIFSSTMLLRDALVKYVANIHFKETSSSMDPLKLASSFNKALVNYFSSPEKFIQFQTEQLQKFTELGQETLSKAAEFNKGLAKASNQDCNDIETSARPSRSDRRFDDPAWQQNPLFYYLQKAYQVNAESILNFFEENLDNHDPNYQSLSFVIKQFVEALSPSNMLLYNPKLLKLTIKKNGSNLLSGVRNFINDLETEKGKLSITQSVSDKFILGKNIAITKGEIIYKNRLFELIFYPSKLSKTNNSSKDKNLNPILIIPPCINKFYILDLTPDSSFIGWMNEKGHDIYCLSWINPTETDKDLTFDDYIISGILQAFEEVCKYHPKDKINLIGYCIGGTLLTTALGYINDNTSLVGKISSVCLITTLLDFEDPGDVSVFINEESVDNLEKTMDKIGYLPSDYLKDTFSLLRSRDLIWTFFINNYLMGRKPKPFAMLSWNNDATRQAPKMFSSYLRYFYLNNLLIIPNAIKIDKKAIDISKLKYPFYIVSAIEDHIAPWNSCYKNTKLLDFSDPNSRFVLSESGHVAGIINPPIKNKYGYYIITSKNQKPAREDLIKESWWINYEHWLTTNFAQFAETSKYESLQHHSKRPKGLYPAPGRYVL